MRLEEELERSGQRIAGRPGPEVSAHGLRRRARRGRAIASSVFLLALVVGGAGIVALGNESRPTPVDVIDDEVPAPPAIEAGNGPSRVSSADGADLGVLASAAPSPTSDPVADRVLEELLDDEIVASRLADLGVVGTRDERAEFLVDAGLVIETSVRDAASVAAADASTALVAADGPEVAIVSVDPTNGEIVGLCGPVATLRRRAGSVYQPLVMAAALGAGVPADELLPAPAEATIPLAPSEWTVANFGGASYEPVTLADALVVAANTPWAGLVGDGRLTPEAVLDVASRFGLSDPPPPVASIVLGIAEVRPLELAGAYATFAAAGEQADLHVIRRILDQEQRLLYSASERGTDRPEVIDRSIAIEVRDAMEQVVARGTGTGAQLQNGTAQFGKTGTTQDFTDAWFAGSTPSLTTVVWVGFLDGSAMANPPVTGGGLPAEIWKAYTLGVTGGTDPAQFPT